MLAYLNEQIALSMVVFVVWKVKQCMFKKPLPDVRTLHIPELTMQSRNELQWDALDAEAFPERQPTTPSHAQLLPPPVIPATTEAATTEPPSAEIGTVVCDPSLCLTRNALE